VKVRGAVHTHTTHSHDGRLSTRELADFFRSRGFQFVAVTEHSQDMTEEKCADLRAECAELSDESFCMIPGIEYSCTKVMHMPAIGITEILSPEDPVWLAREIRRRGGFAVLAHPSRIGWQCSPELARAVNAIEIWNIVYDGKLVPSVEGLDFVRRMLRQHPELLVISAHDLHKPNGFYNVAITMDVPSLTPGAIIAELCAGRYRIASALFSSRSRPNVDGFGYTSRMQFVALANFALDLARAGRRAWKRWTH
jgi:hypothetical protein